MEQIRSKKNRGGRPLKAIKKDRTITVHCSIVERKLIIAKSRKAGITASEYLCKLGVNGKIDSRSKNIPKEILQFTGTLNHIAANLNQVAKKRNSNEVLNEKQIADLETQSKQVKQLAEDIKKYLQ